ncbi:MAG TPA: hypothetical protein VM490_13670, partial [Armatimonadaceae bacterium]|nr:hypothetical protein [Armatimonadaceae bacterium]
HQQRGRQEQAVHFPRGALIRRARVGAASGSAVAVTCFAFSPRRAEAKKKRRTLRIGPTRRA